MKRTNEKWIVMTPDKKEVLCNTGSNWLFADFEKTKINTIQVYKSLVIARNNCRSGVGKALVEKGFYATSEYNWKTYKHPIRAIENTHYVIVKIIETMEVVE